LQSSRNAPRGEGLKQLQNDPQHLQAGWALQILIDGSRT